MIRKIKGNHTYYWKSTLKSNLVELNVDMQFWLYTNYSMTLPGLTSKNLPSSYWDSIKIWSEVGNTTNRDKGDFIWYNKDMNTEDRVLVDKHFLQAGIWYIDDSYKGDGEVKPFEQSVSGLGSDTETSSGRVSLAKHN